MTRPLTLLLLLCVLCGGSLAFALHTGSVTITWSQLWAVLWYPEPGMIHDVVLRIRLPRAVAAFVTGGMLALAGTLMQVLLRNPLADPYILGISGGAAVGALGSLMLGLGTTWITGSAFVGASFSMLLVFGLAHGRGGWTPNRLLLTGVVVAAGWGAIIGLLLTTGPDQTLRGMVFWLMGDLSNPGHPTLGFFVLLVGLAIAVSQGRALNVLSRGEMQAAALGLSVAPLRLTIYGLASLLTAMAVTLAGSIGFVGLVVPHMLRLLGIRDHRWLSPAAVLLGGGLLVFADTLARSLLAPRQLPVGVLTAFIGVPVFLFLLHRSRTVHGQ